MNSIDIEQFNRKFREQLGKTYKFGAEVPVVLEKIESAPEWDCSELTQVVFNLFGSKLPDGADAQYRFCRSVEKAAVGDLGFLWRDEGRTWISHVVYLIEPDRVIEARGQPHNRVIYRPRLAWEKFSRFTGWRMVPDVRFHWPDGRDVRDYGPSKGV